MKLFGLKSRRSRTLLLAVGQLVLIAYVFQVAAFDHWQSDPFTGVMGIPDTSAHAAHSDHCHGAPSTCADGGGGYAQVESGQAVLLPSSKPSLAIAADLPLQSLQQADLLAATKPPRQA